MIQIFLQVLIPLFAIIMMGSEVFRWLRNRKKDDRIEGIEYPKLARLRVQRFQCRLCRKTLEDGDEVIWHERKGGWRSDFAHAQCAVIINNRSGTLTFLDGSEASPSDGQPGTLLLTPEEWTKWRETTFAPTET